MRVAFGDFDRAMPEEVAYFLESPCAAPRALNEMRSAGVTEIVEANVARDLRGRLPSGGDAHDRATLSVDAALALIVPTSVVVGRLRLAVRLREDEIARRPA